MEATIRRLLGKPRQQYRLASPQPSLERRDGVTLGADVSALGVLRMGKVIYISGEAENAQPFLCDFGWGNSSWRGRSEFEVIACN